MGTEGMVTPWWDRPTHSPAGDADKVQYRRCGIRPQELLCSETARTRTADAQLQCIAMHCTPCSVQSDAQLRCNEARRELWAHATMQPAAAAEGLRAHHGAANGLLHCDSICSRLVCVAREGVIARACPCSLSAAAWRRAVLCQPLRQWCR